MFFLYLICGAVFAVSWLTLTEFGERWWAMCWSGAANRHGGDRLILVLRVVLCFLLVLAFWPVFVVLPFVGFLFRIFRK